MKSKEQIELEGIYSKIDNKTINEMSGFQPDEMNSYSAGFFHLAIIMVIYTLAKMGELKDSGKIEELKRILTSDIGLKNKFMSALKRKAPSEQDLKRQKLGLDPVKARRI
jgi:hypothetical protein